MDLYILDNNYNIIGMIDEAESVLWNKKYNDLGYCEIYTSCDNDLLNLLQKGYYVYRYNDDMFCKIDTVEITTDVEQGDHIIATANDISNILSGRIVSEQTTFSGTVANYIKKLLTDSVINPTESERAISNFIVDDSNFADLTETIQASAYTADVLNTILTTCKTYNYGFRVSYNINTHKLVARLYKGVNKATTQSSEYVEFSPSYSNILSSNYKVDESGYKNVAYVGYKETEGDDVFLMTVYNGTEPTGENRKEIYVDGTGTSRTIEYGDLALMFPTVQKDTENLNYYIVSDGQTIIVATYEIDGESNEKITITDYTYLILIQIIGYNALTDNPVTQSFSGEVDTIDTYEYKTDYDLGDIVKVVNEYGISAEARITEIMESDDSENHYQVEPKFEY